MAAEQLVEALNLANEDVYNRPNVQQAISILNETDWNNQAPAEEFRPIVSEIKALLN